MEPNEHANPVSVSENGLGRYQQTISVGQHSFVCDQPSSRGGTDAGPAPYDYLLGALGACTTMTLRMYAERKGLPLAKVSVNLKRLPKITAEGHSDIEHIERQILLDGDLSDEQRQRLLEIANKCPVYRTLCSEFRIDSTIG